VGLSNKVELQRERARTLVDMLWKRDVFTKVERDSSIILCDLFSLGTSTEEQVYHLLIGFRKLFSPFRGKAISDYRRAINNLLYNSNFRERMFDFCKEYVFPYSQNISLFAVLKRLACRKLRRATQKLYNPKIT